MFSRSLQSLVSLAAWKTVREYRRPYGFAEQTEYTENSSKPVFGISLRFLVRFRRDKLREMRGSMRGIPEGNRCTSERHRVRHSRRELGTQSDRVVPDISRWDCERTAVRRLSRWERRGALTESGTENSVREQELSSIHHRRWVVAGGRVGIGVPSPFESFRREDVGGERERSGSERYCEHNRSTIDFRVHRHELCVEDSVRRSERLRLLSLSLRVASTSVDAREER